MSYFQDMVMKIDPDNKDDKTEIIEVSKALGNAPALINAPLSPIQPKSPLEAYSKKSAINLDNG